jgi:hypothetical protein
MTSIISSGLELGHGEFHCVLQSLYHNLVDMHKLTPNIQEVMVFPNWLSVKQNLRKLLSLESVINSRFRNSQKLEDFKFNSRFRNSTSLRVS